jgi:hypothetical protein
MRLLFPRRVASDFDVVVVREGGDEDVGVKGGFREREERVEEVRAGTGAACGED